MRDRKNNKIIPDYPSPKAPKISLRDFLNLYLLTLLKGRSHQITVDQTKSDVFGRSCRIYRHRGFKKLKSHLILIFDISSSQNIAILIKIRGALCTCNGL
jgi:hypothetical protein